LQVLEYWCIFAEKFEWLMKYLDPKADLTFKKVFGEHPELVKSLLNALLPFKSEEEEITSVTYLTPEMVPQTPTRKFSIVDVRCEDAQGRQFIVEMQMVWSAEFKQQVLFNASKAYVKQLNRGEDYSLLKPVYSLNLVNEVFEPELDDYYHYYHLVHEEHTDKVIDGLHLVFVELPKFTPHTFTEKKMQVLWLRYLTEIDEKTKTVPAELLANPEIAKAVSEIEESAYTEEELLGYDEFWDLVSVEKTLAGRLERLTKANDDAKEKLKVTSSQLEATSSQLEATSSQLEATSSQLEATSSQLETTSSQLKEAEEQIKKTEEQRKEAEEQRKEAEEQRKEAEEQLKRANEERMQSAKKLLQAGVSADIVASTLNLSKNELERLIQA
jgi:predicted transposase/invertase (TIGR01784 family)